MSSGPLAGRNIVITGGGAGIGWGISKAVCAQGGRVFFCQRRSGEERAQKLRDQGYDAHFMACDISSPESLRAFADAAIERFGEIHGLINNAGVTIEGDFLDFPLEDLDKLWTTNVRSIFLLSQYLVPHMPKRSAIVNVSSNHSQCSIAGYEMYAATKGGISAMTRAMAWSLGERHIRVTTLSPGLTRTEAVQQVIDNKPELEAGFNAMHADDAFATMEEIGAIGAFLVSPAANALTGAEIIADHGLSAQLVSNDKIK